jgi:hypothetical protein
VVEIPTPTNTTVAQVDTKGMEALEFDEYGNVIIKQRVYSSKELAAM